MPIEPAIQTGSKVEARAGFGCPATGPGGSLISEKDPHDEQLQIASDFAQGDLTCHEGDQIWSVMTRTQMQAASKNAIPRMSLNGRHSPWSRHQRKPC